MVEVESRADTAGALGPRNESKGPQGFADWPKGTAWSGTGEGGPPRGGGRSLQPVAAISAISRLYRHIVGLLQEETSLSLSLSVCLSVSHSFLPDLLSYLDLCPPCHIFPYRLLWTSCDTSLLDLLFISLSFLTCYLISTSVLPVTSSPMDYYGRL